MREGVREEPTDSKGGRGRLQLLLLAPKNKLVPILGMPLKNILRATAAEQEAFSWGNIWKYFLAQTEGEGKTGESEGERER